MKGYENETDFESKQWQSSELIHMKRSRKSRELQQKQPNESRSSSFETLQFKHKLQLKGSAPNSCIYKRFRWILSFDEFKKLNGKFCEIEVWNGNSQTWKQKYF
jgi:hypothetical protein